MPAQGNFPGDIICWLLKVSSQSRKSEFRVLSIVHLNIDNFACTQPISTKYSSMDMTDIGKFTELENKMVPLLPWKSLPSEFEVQKNDSLAFITEIMYLKQNFLKCPYGFSSFSVFGNFLLL